MNTKAGRNILAATVCAVVTILALAGSVKAGDVVVNEFWAQDGYSASAQYVELYNKGASAVSLAGYSIIQVDGDTWGYPGSYNYRWVTFRQDLSGSIAAGARFVIGSGLTPNPDISFRLGTMKTTGTSTYALVRTSEIAYTDGIHLTQASVDAITANTLTDAVTNWDGDLGDDGYFNAPVITEVYAGGQLTWSTASRMPDGGPWSNDFGQYNSTTPIQMEIGDANDHLSTPGQANGKDSTIYPRVLYGACCAGSVCTYGLKTACAPANFKGTWRDCSHPRNPCDPNPPSNTIAYAKTQGPGWGGRVGPVTVTCILDLAASSNSATIVVQDTSGPSGAARGLMIFGLNATITNMLVGVTPGKVITVDGTTTEAPFGVFELEDNTYMPLARVGTITQGTMPAPVTKTCAELRVPATAEALESTRVTIDCASFISSGTFAIGASGSSFTITDGTAFFETFIPTWLPPLAGSTIPTVPKSITGILSQHDITSPYDTGYQLVIYDLADIAAPSAGCVVGRCCQPAGTCMTTSAAVCSQLCGVFTPGGNCGTACTPITTGACKMPGAGPCYDNYTLAQCNTAGGAYWGDGSTCAHGQCYPTLTLDQVRALGASAGLVKLQDVVVSSTTDLVSSTNSRNFMVQDNSGTAGAPRGITVWGTNADVLRILNGPDGLPGTADDVVPGDRITMAGLVNDYQGLLEYVIPMSLISKGTPAGIPTPAKVGVAEFSGTAVELLESTLVEVDCVTFITTGNFAYGNQTAVANGTTAPAFSIRVSTGNLDLVGQPIPTEPVNLTGILSQNGNIYQLLLRSMADIHEECPETCYGLLGDFNGNSDVDLGDLTGFVNALLGTVPNACADMNADGKVNGLDVQLFISRLMHEPPAGTIQLARCDNATPPNDCPTQNQSGFNEFCAYTVVDNAETQAMLIGLPSCINNPILIDGNSVCVLCSTPGAACPANNPGTQDFQVFRWKDGISVGQDCYFVGVRTSPSCFNCVGASDYRFRVVP